MPVLMETPRTTVACVQLSILGGCSVKPNKTRRGPGRRGSPKACPHPGRQSNGSRGGSKSLDAAAALPAPLERLRRHDARHGGVPALTCAMWTSSSYRIQGSPARLTPSLGNRDSTRRSTSVASCMMEAQPLDWHGIACSSPARLIASRTPNTVLALIHTSISFILIPQLHCYPHSPVVNMQEAPHTDATTGTVPGHYAAAPPTYRFGDDFSSEGKKSDPELMMPVDKTATVQEGSEKFKRLGWKRLTVCLIVEAIALGSLSIPSAFAKLGMVAGVIMCVGLGLVAIYTSYVVGQVKLRHPEVAHYSDAVELIWGRFGKELTGVMFALFLILLVGSHALTGTIAFINIVDNYKTCALVWGVVSLIILLILALPPTFAEFAILGYIDFISIIAAILVTIIATGVQAHNAPGGLSAVNWTALPPPETTFYEAFLATTNIIFAYSFAVCQFSFMSEMHTPKEYVKSIWALGLIEIFIYTITGALIYAFVGQEVKSPALLSAGDTVSRIAFGIALPVIFISGSINGTVVGRYIMDRAFPNSPIRFVQGAKGWGVWIALISVVTVIGFVIAEAIPFFNALLGLISSLFISGFTFYFPALFWFQLVKVGKWNAGWKNISLSILNACTFIIGLAVLGCGTYASVEDILTQYNSGSVRSPFTCDASSYA
ncbi:hypothetical protein T440DRAFT_483869 [Plenodomus tracheiphilus IPT5]|uniref:Amino acid transporter transmembrane domain-containing protein n=1 Tax=Plenodomus tracheiphilus IPT5 TaxID=1408161 RepID=A0A6A7ANK8_9PLEO|nr:hypothetical protein T440DRAFT_483869 [Plenodomus tracheiphilus IPT5]